MPKLRVLSGQDLVKIFNKLGFAVAAQRGSHIKLRRVTADGSVQILTIPSHKEIKTGTLKAIYNQALRFISEAELRKEFYQ
ncbi:MAG: type II toxin-antitoxin system HicA family toxin [Candidatus Doudnabacteria bacterium]|nr:type II toxin-antitoxin system HicA family toxin [Candidatus Doudnabacteria bacterium]